MGSEKYDIAYLLGFFRETQLVERMHISSRYIFTNLTFTDFDLSVNLMEGLRIWYLVSPQGWMLYV